MGALSGGFSGKFDDLRDLPELPIGLSLNEYRTQVNRLISQQARNDFEDGLDALNYPDGFFDVFVDESKIATKTDVFVQGVALSLRSFSEVNLPDDDTQFTNNLKQGNIINPNESLNFISAVISSNTSGFSTAYLTRDSDGNVIATKDISNLQAGDEFTFSANLSSGVDYRVQIDNNGSDYTVGYNSSPSYPYTSTKLDVTAAVEDANQSTSVTRALTSISGGTINSNGSFTSTVNNLGYQATEWTPTAEYTLNGQDLELELQDGSGNTIAVATESEIGKTISISTTATSYQMEGRLIGDGTQTPILNRYENGLDD